MTGCHEWFGIESSTADLFVKEPRPDSPGKLEQDIARRLIRVIVNLVGTS